MTILRVTALLQFLGSSGLHGPEHVVRHGFVPLSTKPLNYYPPDGKCPYRWGPFEEIRLGLDFDWHGCYPEWRYRVQDALIKELMLKKTYYSSGGIAPPELNGQWVVFTAGAMGAGKGFVMKYLYDNHLMPLDSFVVVDPDWIRMNLPEWDYLVETIPDSAGSVVQKECGYLAEIAREALIREKKNVLVDGSLRDTRWALKDITQLKAIGLKIGVIHVTGSLVTIQQQAESREKGEEKKERRHIEPAWVVNSFKGSRKSFKRLSRLSLLLDFAVQIYNPGKDGEPLLKVFRIHGKDQALKIENIKHVLLSSSPSMPS